VEEEKAVENQDSSVERVTFQFLDAHNKDPAGFKPSPSFSGTKELQWHEGLMKRALSTRSKVRLDMARWHSNDNVSHDDLEFTVGHANNSLKKEGATVRPLSKFFDTELLGSESGAAAREAAAPSSMKRNAAAPASPALKRSNVSRPFDEPPSVRFNGSCTTPQNEEPHLDVTRTSPAWPRDTTQQPDELRKCDSLLEGPPSLEDKTDAAARLTRTTIQYDSGKEASLTDSQEDFMHTNRMSVPRSLVETFDCSTSLQSAFEWCCLNTSNIRLFYHGHTRLSEHRPSQSRVKHSKVSIDNNNYDCTNADDYFGDTCSSSGDSLYNKKKRATISLDTKESRRRGKLAWRRRRHITKSPSRNVYQC
jgi:hypothetical protein